MNAGKQTFDPILGRVPTTLAQALIYSADTWVTPVAPVAPAVRYALEAASANTRAAYAND